MIVEVVNVDTAKYRDEKAMLVNYVWKRTGSGVWYVLGSPCDAPAPIWSTVTKGEWVIAPLIPYMSHAQPIDLLARGMQAAVAAVARPPITQAGVQVDFKKLLIMLGTPLEQVPAADGTPAYRQWIGFAGRA